MRKETITYEDYNGVKRTEDFYFSFNKAELMEMELSSPGGSLKDRLQRLIDSPEPATITSTFKDIILNAYGVKSEDGRRFMKSPELAKAFSETEAYSDLWMHLATDQDYAVAFIRDLMPKDLITEMDKQNKDGKLLQLPGADVNA